VVTFHGPLSLPLDLSFEYKFGYSLSLPLDLSFEYKFGYSLSMN
jgi:hypothetical protein